MGTSVVGGRTGARWAGIGLGPASGSRRWQRPGAVRCAGRRGNRHRDRYAVRHVRASAAGAPGLRVAVVPWTTSMPTAAALELAVLWAAESAGAAQRLVDLSVAYAKDRKQFGKPIGSFQAIKHRLADMHAKAQYAQTAVIWASLEPDNAARASRYALDTAISVAESSIQVHGGMGFTWEMGLHYYLRSMLTRRELVQGLLA